MKKITETARCIREISFELHDLIENEEEIDVEQVLILLEEIGVMATTIVGDYTDDQFKTMVNEILLKWKEREKQCNMLN